MDSIKVEGLTKRFGKTLAVDNVSFSVKKGEIFAFLGPNGAGKTTTIRMLTTLLEPTSGAITVNGYNPLKEQDKVRHSFGIVFQDPSLDEELTAYENMEFHGILYNIPLPLRKQRIEEMLKFVELWDRKNDFVKTFSGGMKRRLEIARGLLHRPEIIFLDEPTLGLDPQTRNHIWSYIKKLNQEENLTVFFTTHYMEEAEKIADSIAIIDHAKIVAVGTLAELKKKAKAKTLEDVFLKLTGSEIRDEGAKTIDELREHRKMWRRAR